MIASVRHIFKKKDTCIISDAGVSVMSLEGVRWSYITSSDSKELLSSSVMKPMIPSKCESFMTKNRALCETILIHLIHLTPPSRSVYTVLLSPLPRSQRRSRQRGSGHRFQPVPASPYYDNTPDASSDPLPDTNVSDPSRRCGNPQK